MAEIDTRDLPARAARRVLTRLGDEGNELAADEEMANEVARQVAAIAQSVIERGKGGGEDHPESLVNVGLGIRRAASGVHPAASLRAATICFEETFPLLLERLEILDKAGAIREAIALQEAVAESVLQASTGYVDYLLARLNTVYFEERRVIAAHLHDRTAQSIVSAMQRLQYETIPTADVRDILAEALREVRAVALDLRQFVGDRRLDQALQNYVSDLEIDEHRVRIVAWGEPRRFPALQQEAAFLIVREAVLNALKHSCAPSVEIRLTWTSEAMRAEVIDDGAGFDRASTGQSRMGLVICRERADAIGAEFEIHSSPGHGTSVDLLLPL